MNHHPRQQPPLAVIDDGRPVLTGEQRGQKRGLLLHFLDQPVHGLRPHQTEDGAPSNPQAEDDDREIRQRELPRDATQHAREPWATGDAAGGDGLARASRRPPGFEAIADAPH